MLMILKLFLAILMILSILIILINSISMKSFSDREKSSPFECGFTPQTPARLPFSLQFFLIAIMFLIFDVEIVLLLPVVLTLPISSLTSYSLSVSIFILILIWGLFHEWNHGALDWAK
nr:NADH dehydrogenase subunit 3 [Clytomelegena kabakovi]